MIPSLQWLVATELIGLAFLPVTLWLLGALPDRGYAFAKVLGLLLATYVTWLAGNILPVGSSNVVPTLTALCAAGGWWVFRRSLRATLLEIRHLIAIEEALFLAAFVGWTIVRTQVLGASIGHTEQFMDLTFLQGSLHSATFPPYDAWMSGHGINYYYFGYLMFATLTRLSGVAASVGYNLSLSLVFALTVTSAYSVCYSLVRKIWWPLLAPLFVALIGNWHAALWEIPRCGISGTSTPDFWSWLWQSTRVVGNNFTVSDSSCAGAAHSASNTINEYPFFSFVLGDLHPHVMALPVVLLVLALSIGFLRSSDIARPDRNREVSLRLLLFAVCAGSLFVINSWDFPTYLLAAAACVFARAYLDDARSTWWQPPLLTVAAMGLLSVLLYLPFYAGFKSLARGFGWVSTPTDLFEFVQVNGLWLSLSALLVVTLSFLLRPAEEEVSEDVAERTSGTLTTSSETGASNLDTLVVAASIMVASVFLHRAVLAILLLLGVYAASVLYRALNSEEQNGGDIAALLFVLVGLAALALTEVGYIRDVFDGGGGYRMNTVFKFYYQAWVVLALACSYSAYRVWVALRGIFGRYLGWLALTLMAVGVAAAGVYTRYLPAYAVGVTNPASIDGMEWLQQQHPGDYAAIKWLSANAAPQSVVLEAVGGDYGYSGRISTFTGLPTVMGWAGHEAQWRPGDGSVGERSAAVQTLYSTRSLKQARHLLRRYHVKYVIIGDTERTTYASAGGLAKFAHILKPVFRSSGTIVYGP